MISVKKISEEIKSVSALINNKGWADGTSGNVSFNAGAFLPQRSGRKNILKILKHRFELDGLSDKTLIISSSGAKFRNFPNNNGKNFCALKINSEAGKSFIIRINGFAESDRPSSELFTHLLLHNYLSLNRPEYKWILHVHPEEVILLSHIYNSRQKSVLNKDILNTSFEIKYIMPDGIGYVSVFEPGSIGLAGKTVDEFKHRNIVIWEKHGCIAVGRSFEEAYDVIDCLVKAACIIIKLKIIK